MLRTTSRLPASRINVLLFACLVLGTVITALLGNWFMSSVLLIMSAAEIGMVGYARRADARVITRINAIEYRDERDVLLAKEGLTAVGVAALTLSIVAFIVVAVRLGDARADALDLFVILQLLVLNVVWGISNSLVVRRAEGSSPPVSE
jgi:hypothetical protein